MYYFFDCLRYYFSFFSYLRCNCFILLSSCNGRAYLPLKYKYREDRMSRIDPEDDWVLNQEQFIEESHRHKLPTDGSYSILTARFLRRVRDGKKLDCRLRIERTRCWISSISGGDGFIRIVRWHLLVCRGCRDFRAHLVPYVYPDIIQRAILREIPR